ncbi:Uncharacterised protein [Yersinia mollaretii]|uniref:Uncharacterized protein n=1 Tax=Yersinia mollaretii TaxID=33060 RepID=A0AA36LJF1_YERMO|nr:hypothetical protein CS537_08955 [Yersinia mollaretii]CNE10375.1 Uncharacterised protein [Yersinia mollaretii]CNH47300.1 Uncharacterised protein [Yersinia mollaretii]CQJ07738.1 Uncharacterised protein [Yersinia mollaretii]
MLNHVILCFYSLYWAGHSIICINFNDKLTLTIAVDDVPFLLILVINGKLHPFVAQLYQIIANRHVNLLLIIKCMAANFFIPHR